MSNKNFTEFYLYSGFIEVEKIDNAKYREIIHTSIHSNPEEDWSIKFINQKMYTNNKWKLFGLHRNSIDKMGVEYKKKLLEMYKYLYGDCKYIKNILHI